MAPFSPLRRSRQLLSTGRPLRLVCYGDSISEVGRQPEWHGGASLPSHNWARVLGHLLGEHFPDSAVTAINFGIGGQNSYEGLGRLDALEEHHPDLVLVAFGANDCVYHHLQPSETRLALSTLGRDAQVRYGCDVVLLGTPGDNPLDSRFEHLDATIEATREAAEDAGVNFIDLRGPILAATVHGQQWTNYFRGPADCHPNDRGHALWAETVFKALLPWLTG